MIGATTPPPRPPIARVEGVCCAWVKMDSQLDEVEDHHEGEEMPVDLPEDPLGLLGVDLTHKRADELGRFVCLTRFQTSEEAVRSAHAFLWRESESGT